MDNRKKAMILDGASDLYSLIRDILELAKGDPRAVQLDHATEAYLKEILDMEEAPAQTTQLRLVVGGQSFG